MVITKESITQFKCSLIEDEKAKATVEKYLHDVEAFMLWCNGREINKSTVLEYKNYLSDHLAPSSVNCALSSINSFFAYFGHYELKVKKIRIQKQIFADQDKELSKAEYERLLDAARRKKNQRIYLLMQTVCSTGIRVSELKYVTSEALSKGCCDINCKGKLRRVYLPVQLCRALRQYAKSQNITHGSVFVSKNGNPLDRSNIWSEMKKLCRIAKVSDKKVFPHNLRHLFARTYYSLEKDIVRLADVLGHSSVNTTRIYTKESGEIHRRAVQKLGLLRC